MGDEGDVVEEEVNRETIEKDEQEKSKEEDQEEKKLSIMSLDLSSSSCDLTRGRTRI